MQRLTSYAARRLGITLFAIGLALLAPAPASAQFVLDVRAPDPEMEAPGQDMRQISEVASVVSANAPDLAATLDVVNSYVTIDRQVPVIFTSWDQPNAAYTSEYDAIVLSYSLIQSIREVFEAAGAYDPATWYPNIDQIMLHEIGHALVDIKNLPPEGANPESIADQLGFYFMSLFYDQEQLENVAAFFLLRAQAGGGLEDRSSEHFPDAERGIDYLCWIEGLDQIPDGTYRAYTGDRACASESAVVIGNWGVRLGEDYADVAAPEEAVEYFDVLLADGLPFDVALDWVAYEFGAPVAVSDAVYRCAPVADPECRDSYVASAWQYFRDPDTPVSVAAVVDQMIASGIDPYLTYAIATYWCSPAPGEGCGPDVFSDAWTRYGNSLAQGASPSQAIDALTQIDMRYAVVAELIGAAECGEPTCWAGSALSTMASVNDGSGKRPRFQFGAEGGAMSGIKKSLCERVRGKNHPTCR